MHPVRFSGNGVQLSYEWLRDGAVIGGAVAASAGPQGPAGPAGPQGLAGRIPTIHIECWVTKKKDIVCEIGSEDDSRYAKASARLLGSKQRATARSRGKVRVRLDTRSKVRRGARVEVRYVSGKAKGRAVVRLGKAVRIKGR